MTATTAGARAATDGQVTTRFRGVLRDIARGGLAGMVVGLIGGGIGGRIVMRLAAMLVPEAAGSFTENGNRVGESTLLGSLTLLAFGVTAGVIAAPIWVVVSPWIPGAGLRRAALAMPVAVALGAVGLVDGGNVDFFVMRHDRVVVGLLIALVALIGFLFVLIDEALDRRLPIAAGRAAAIYALLTAAGMLVVVPLALAFVTASDPLVMLAGLTLIGVGVATLYRWVLRVQDRQEPEWFVLAGRAALVLAVVAGFARVRARGRPRHGNRLTALGDCSLEPTAAQPPGRRGARGSTPRGGHRAAASTA